MNNAREWITLQNALGYHSAKAFEASVKSGGVDRLLGMDEQYYRSLSVFNENEIAALLKSNFQAADKTIEYCEQKGYTILTPDDKEYPILLKRLNNPPAALYIKGKLPNADILPCVGMVGTRKATNRGLALAERMSYRLANAGATIISGGAAGIDIYCTKGALAANMPSVIVLGCGLDYPYLPQNEQYREKVAQNGALVTEYQPHYAPSRYTFPNRNRIIAALSYCVVVVQSPVGSGALITARNAYAQGKPVYALPGDICSQSFSGNNQLLRECAKPVFAPKDIADELFDAFPLYISPEKALVSMPKDLQSSFEENDISSGISDEDSKQSEQQKAKELRTAKEPRKPKKPSKRKKPQTQQPQNQQQQQPKPFSLPPLGVSISENAENVYNCFTNEVASMDILIENSGLSVNDTIAAVTELEIEGVITAVSGARYRVINN